MNMSDLLVKLVLILPPERHQLMKKFTGFVVIIAFLLSACGGQKPYYKTKAGKKKQKYYNDIQFGGKSASEMKKP
jgi:hypothetical protein